MDWTPVMERCAPDVAAVTLRAIVTVESAHNPLALNVNGFRLGRQPKDLREAQSWLRWLMERGHSVDVGLTQVNTVHFARFGLTPDNAFDPCRNLAAGAKVLHEAYRLMRARQPDPQIAVRQAVSAYNTGSAERGFRNGYVARVETAVRQGSRTSHSKEPIHGIVQR
jgi:type IV secretion system protein VirB1